MTTNETKKTESCGCTSATKDGRQPSPRCGCGERCRCGDACACVGCSHRKS